jgi:hypothetical protein
LQGKEEAQKRLTKLLKSLKKLLRQKKSLMEQISVGTDGVDVSTKMEQAQLECKFLVVKPKLKLKNNPVFLI